MISKFIRYTLILILVVASIVALHQPNTASANVQNWFFTTANTATITHDLTFGNGDTSSILMESGAGTGSGAGGKGFVGRTDMDGTTLGSLSSLSYSAFISPSSGHTYSTLTISMNLMVDANNDGQWTSIGDGDDILVFEPHYSYGNPAIGAWETYDALSSQWWSVRRIISQPNPVDMPSNYSLWSDIMAGTTNGIPNTDLKIYSPTTSTAEWHQYAILFQVGQKSGGVWANFIGYLDNVTLNGVFYDFQLASAATSSYPIANEGMIKINTHNPVPAYGCPDCEVARTSTGADIILPHDWDGNGFDTYVVTACTEIDGTIWTSIFLGSANFGWVQLFDGKVEIVSGGLPESCLP